MELIKYLNKNLIFIDVPCSEKNMTIEYMVDKLCDVCGISDRKAVLATVFQREADRSTGLGSELAVPHARTNLAEVTYVALGICKRGVVWESIDGLPVKFIFLVVGAPKAAEEYLNVLADISKLMKRHDIKHALLDAHNADEVMSIIENSKVRDQIR